MLTHKLQQGMIETQHHTHTQKTQKTETKKQKPTNTHILTSEKTKQIVNHKEKKKKSVELRRHYQPQKDQSGKTISKVSSLAQ